MKYYLPCIKCGQTVERVSDIKNAVCFECKTGRRTLRNKIKPIVRVPKKKKHKPVLVKSPKPIIKKKAQKEKPITSKGEYFINGVSNIHP